MDKKRKMYGEENLSGVKIVTKNNMGIGLGLKE